MSLFASFAGSRATSARLTISSWGAAVADVQLADDAEVAPRGTLTIGDLSLVMSTLRGGAFAGSRALRLVGGAGGWRTVAPRQAYADPKGVKLATVVRDVAAKVGETVSFASDFASRLLGQFWARADAPASEVLALTVGRSWYVDPAGVTQIGERPTTTIASGFDVLDFRPNLGLVVIATETLAPWVPGAVFKSPLLAAPLTASSVTIALNPKGKLRVEVLTA